jgi:hypothetical protein
MMISSPRLSEQMDVSIKAIVSIDLTIDENALIVAKNFQWYDGCVAALEKRLGLDDAHADP